MCKDVKLTHYVLSNTAHIIKMTAVDTMCTYTVVKYYVHMQLPCKFASIMAT